MKCHIIQVSFFLESICDCQTDISGPHHRVSIHSMIPPYEGMVVGLPQPPVRYRIRIVSVPRSGTVSVSRLPVQVTILITWSLLKFLPPRLSLPAGWLFNVVYLLAGYHFALNPDSYTLPTPPTPSSVAIAQNVANDKVAGPFFIDHYIFRNSSIVVSGFIGFV